jgi:hypothetical protein
VTTRDLVGRRGESRSPARSRQTIVTVRSGLTVICVRATLNSSLAATVVASIPIVVYRGNDRRPVRTARRTTTDRLAAGPRQYDPAPCTRDFKVVAESCRTTDRRTVSDPSAVDAPSQSATRARIVERDDRGSVASEPAVYIRRHARAGERHARRRRCIDEDR